MTVSLIKESVAIDEMIESLPSHIDADAFRAYIELIGFEWATVESFEEAYAGEFRSDEDFAQEMADEIGAIDQNLGWPYSCIDWTHAARELMFDYSEEGGYYFRNL